MARPFGRKFRASDAARLKETARAKAITQLAALPALAETGFAVVAAQRRSRTLAGRRQKSFSSTLMQWNDALDVGFAMEAAAAAFDSAVSMGAAQLNLLVLPDPCTIADCEAAITHSQAMFDGKMQQLARLQTQMVRVARPEGKESRYYVSCGFQIAKDMQMKEKNARLTYAIAWRRAKATEARRVARVARDNAQGPQPGEKEPKESMKLLQYCLSEARVKLGKYVAFKDVRIQQKQKEIAGYEAKIAAKQRFATQRVVTTSSLPRDLVLARLREAMENCTLINARCALAAELARCAEARRVQQQELDAMMVGGDLSESSSSSSSDSESDDDGIVWGFLAHHSYTHGIKGPPPGMTYSGHIPPPPEPCQTCGGCEYYRLEGHKIFASYEAQDFCQDPSVTKAYAVWKKEWSAKYAEQQAS